MPSSNFIAVINVVVKFQYVFVLVLIIVLVSFLILAIFTVALES